MKYTKTHKIKSLVLEFNEHEIAALTDLCEITGNWVDTYGVAGYSQARINNVKDLIQLINHALKSDITSDISII